MEAGNSFEPSSSTLFLGMQFFLAGFDPATEKQVVAELERNGGRKVGSYDEGCTHVIVSQLPYEDPICKIAREHGRKLLSDYWIVDCLDYGMIMDVKNVIYKPLQDLNGIHGSEALCICLTGYQGQARREIMKMVEMIGAKFTKPLIASKVTHLICYKFEGDKYNLAKRLGIKLVNQCWLEDCLKTWTLLPEENYAISGWELELANEEAKDSEEGEDTKTGVGEATPDQRSPFPIGAKSKLSGHMDNVQNFSVSHKNPVAHTSVQLIENHILMEAAEGILIQDFSPKSMQFTSPENSCKDKIKQRYDTHDELELEAQKEWRTPSEKKMHVSIFDDMKVEPLTEDVLKKQNRISKPSKDSPRANLDASGSVKKSASERTCCTAEKTKIKSHKRRSLLSEKTLMEGDNCITKVTLSVQDREEEPYHDSKTPKSSRRSKSAGRSDSHHAYDRSSLGSKEIEVNNDVEVSKSESNHVHGLLDGTRNSVPAYDAQSPAQEKEVEQLEVLNTVTRLSHACNAENTNEQVFETSLAGLDGAGTDNANKENVPLSAKVHLSSPKSKIQEGLLHTSPSKKCKSSAVKEVNVLGIVRSSKSKGKQTGKKVDLNKENSERKTAAPVSVNISQSPTNMEVRRLDFEATNLEGDSLETVCIARELLELQNAKELNSSDGQTCEKSSSNPGNSEFRKPPESTDGQETLDHCSRKRHKKGQPLMHSISNKESGLLSAAKVSPAASMIVACAPKDILKQQEDKNLGQETIDNCPRKRHKKGQPLMDSVSNNESGLLSAAKVSPAASVIVACAPKDELEQQEDKNVEKHKISKSIEPIDLTHTRQKKGKNGSRKKTANTPSHEKGKLISAVQLQKHEVSSQEAQKRCFALSGHRNEKEKFLKMIKELGGHACRNDHRWNNRVTHVVFASPLRRTEKFFAAAAAGRWILTGKYLEASRQAGRFVSEEAYEWYGAGDNDEGTISLGAPRKWRLWKEKTGCGAFYGMRVLIYGECISPPLDTLKHAIKAGGGTILASSPPYTRHLVSGVDYAIISFGIPREDQWVSEFLKHKVACVASDYLVEFICKPFSPLGRHVLYGSEAAVEIAQKRLTDAVNSSVKQDTHDCKANLKKQNQKTKSQKRIREQATGSISDPLVDIACFVCAQTDREDVMLLCGDDQGRGCGVAIHIDCCQPSLQSVPEEDWFCIACSRIEAA
ncbi:hypothetical protein O6H91_05G079000 [Diphasiastrum complanatum]|uniref:Uncharacterized protein n=1 Tax=Diphasiastrum complanatum TaxID=34168 RepID=A0ACC2DPZ9_DIPCM|nr:hypothetical protein O6H91_05G079000 [Diphasiastrum complanatum]